MLNDKFDVIIFDNIGMPFTGTTPCFTSLGGSELELILLAESLAKIQKKVLVLCNTQFPAYENGVYYYSVFSIGEKKIKCDNLLINRYSRLNSDNIEFKNLFFFLQDIYNQEHIAYFLYIQSVYKNTIFITVSNWLKKQLPSELNTNTIHNMLPDWLESFKTSSNPYKFIYCSAAFKGLLETIELWKVIKSNSKYKKAELFVCNPGYDQVNIQLLKENKIQFLGNLNFYELTKEIAGSAGLFYANKVPETFCIVAAMAQTLGTRPHILCLNGQGALPEILTNTEMITNDVKQFMQNFDRYYNNTFYDEKKIGNSIYSSRMIFMEWKRLFKYD